jgi:hypothetical protein
VVVLRQQHHEEDRLGLEREHRRGEERGAEEAEILGQVLHASSPTTPAGPPHPVQAGGRG